MPKTALPPRLVQKVAALSALDRMRPCSLPIRSGFTAGLAQQRIVAEAVPQLQLSPRFARSSLQQPTTSSQGWTQGSVIGQWLEPGSCQTQRVQTPSSAL
jgi:hypothetical protein